jgi:hypothetical protein
MKILLPHMGSEPCILPRRDDCLRLARGRFPGKPCKNADWNLSRKFDWRRFAGPLTSGGRGTFPEGFLCKARPGKWLVLLAYLRGTNSF